MKTFKKIVLALICLIAILAIGLFLWYKIRSNASKQVLVHEQSTAIIKVAVDDIGLDIAKNALLHPGYYFGRRDTAKEDPVSTPAIYQVIDIPANLYFFSLSDTQKTWYVSLTVKDERDLKAYLRTHLTLDSLDIVEERGYWKGRSSDQRISFCGDGQTLLLSYQFGKPHPLDEIVEVWSNRSSDLVAIAQKEDYMELRSAKSDLIWYNASTDDMAKLNFLNGEVKADIDINSYLWKFSTAPRARTMVNDQVLSGFCDADLDLMIDKYGPQLFKSYAISLDSLKRYYGRYLDFQWKRGDVIQQDTIVSYDYDDNFELVEQQVIKQDSVPNLAIHLRMSPHIAGYLPQKLFYSFHQRRDGQLIGLYTGTDSHESAVFSPVDVALSLHYQKQIEATKYLAWLPEQVNLVREILLTGKYKDEQRSAFDLKIGFDRMDIHPLGHFF